jgi:CMP-N,N'-diacetyllegionaminic acid synthase
VNALSCVISARLGSTRTPRKMVRPFAGSSLLEVLLRKLQRVKNLDPERIWLSAHEDEIRAVGERVGVKIYRRSYESTLEPNTLDVIYRYAWDLPVEHVLVVNGCNPLLRVETIERAIEAFQAHAWNSLFTVVERRNFFWSPEGRMLNRFLGEDKYLATLETKMVEPVYEAGNSLFIWRASFLREHGVFWTMGKDDPHFFPIPDEEFIDIDHPWQFQLAERLYRERFAPDVATGSEAVARAGDGQGGER